MGRLALLDESLQAFVGMDQLGKRLAEIASMLLCELYQHAIRFFVEFDLVPYHSISVSRGNAFLGILLAALFSSPAQAIYLQPVRPGSGTCCSVVFDAPSAYGLHFLLR